MSKTIEALAELYRRPEIGMTEVADLLCATAAIARKNGGPEEFSTRVEVPALIFTSQEQDRQLRDALRPFVQNYQKEAHVPELIDFTWQSIWEVIGKRVNYEYQVPRCDRTSEELMQLKKQGKAALLLPDDIYTPNGLIRLGTAFPLMNNWTTTPEDAIRISHGLANGGCIDIEMSLDAPYRTSRGYNEQELKDKIAADRRRGQRLPTYLVGSQFSQLLTGNYFDEHTLSRLPESFYDGQALSAHFNSHGEMRVRSWSPEARHPDLGGRSEGVKRA